MGLLDFLWGLFGGKTKPVRPKPQHNGATPREPEAKTRRRAQRRVRRRAYLVALRRRKLPIAELRTPLSELTVPALPYQFARNGVVGGFLDLSRDGDDSRLASFGLPSF